jgi:hypothetical protein
MENGTDTRRTGQPEWDSQYRTTRTGQAERDREQAAITRLSEQYCYDRIARAAKLGQVSQSITGQLGQGQSEKESQNGTSRMEQVENTMQNWTANTGLQV